MAFVNEVFGLQTGEMIPFAKLPDAVNGRLHGLKLFGRHVRGLPGEKFLYVDFDGHAALAGFFRQLLGNVDTDFHFLDYTLRRARFGGVCERLVRSAGGVICRVWI